MRSVNNIVIIIALILSVACVPKDSDYIYPTDVATIENKQLALRQTTEARHLLYTPNNFLLDELSIYAERCLDFITELQEITDNKAYEELLAGIRVFDPQHGYLRGKHLADLIDIINRVIDGSADGTDIAGLFNFIGDIGTCVTDYNENQKRIVTALENTFGLTNLAVLGQNILKAKGGNIIAPLKKGNAKVTPKIPSERYWDATSWKVRAGILETGSAADGKLKNFIESKPIQSADWPKQFIMYGRVKQTKEPWSGHMSGSIVEVLMMLDIISGENPMLPYDNATVPNTSVLRIKLLATKERRSKAAISLAFLIGIGYHSAMECLETVTAYLGNDLRRSGDIPVGKDAGLVLGNFDATTTIDRIISEFIYNPLKRNNNLRRS